MKSNYYFGIFLRYIELKLVYLNILYININIYICLTESNYWLSKSKEKNISIANFYRWDEWLDHPTDLAEAKWEWERGINCLLNLLKPCSIPLRYRNSSVIRDVWAMGCFGKADKQATSIHRLPHVSHKAGTWSPYEMTE